MRLVPKWIALLGIAVAICGELSWFYLMVPGALPLVPLTRFPGFVWMIAIGLALPSSTERFVGNRRAQGRERDVRAIERAAYSVGGLLILSGLVHLAVLSDQRRRLGRAGVAAEGRRRSVFPSA